MKSTQSLEKSDKWIVGLTVLCAVLLFSWLVYDIAFLNPLLEGQVPVGKIYEAQNRVKRKFNKSLIWYPAENNEIVYENDWIFTGSMSIAKIKLDSGGEIVIEPDSLIILSRKNGILQLNLQHGRLMADVKSKDISINVLRDGKLQKIDTQKGAIQISQDDSDKVDEILDLDSDDNGDDDISLSELADRKFYEAKSGFSDLDEMGLSYKIENDFEFQLYEGQKGDVVFDWIDPYGKWTSFEAEASEEANFKNIISNYSGLNSEFIFPTDQSGPLYWRVRGVDKNGKKSNWSERLTVNVSVEFLEKGEPLELSRNSMLYQLDKNDLQNVKADNSYDVTDDKPVEISWKALEKASSYKVQISGKEDFSDILEEKIVKNNSLKLTNIKIGQTHFRVVPENEQGVSIAKAAKGKVMTYFPPPEESSLKTQDKGDHQILKWGKVPYAKAYKVTYKTDPESDIEKTKIVTGTNFKLTDNTGFVQWKVRVVDPESNRAMSSNSNTVDWYDSAKRLASVHGSGMAGTDFPKITKPEPRKTFISVNSSPLFIVINWQFDKGASEYEVEVSQKADMSGTVFKRRVKGKKRAVINQKFEPGIYYMRVRAMQENVTHERWSETEVFRVMDRKAQ